MTGLLLLAVVVLAFVLRRQGQRIQSLETRLSALQGEAHAALDALASMPTELPKASEPEPSPDPVEVAGQPGGPWATARQTDKGAVTFSPKPPAPSEIPVAAKRPDIETTLGSRWAVWVGGVALALGGVFMVRYSIEAGIFGPEVRLCFAVVFGVLLAAVGEFLRRRGFTSPIGGIKGAYVPAILTAASSFTLFAAIYAAHGIYGFIGPATAFVLLALVALGTLGAALLHGQALAGLGLLGSYLTPILVASDAPNAWTLFSYLTVVLVAAVAIASLRGWRFLAGASYLGAGLWSLVYLVATFNADTTPVVLLQVAGLAILAVGWIRFLPQAFGRDPVPIIASVSLAIVALVLGTSTDFTGPGGPSAAALLCAASLAVAAFLPRAMPLLHAAGVVALLIAWQGFANADITMSLAPGGGSFETAWGSPEAEAFLPFAIVLAIAALGAGVAVVARRGAGLSRYKAFWAFWACALPLGVLAAEWIQHGNLDVDPLRGSIAFLLAAILATAGEFAARRDETTDVSTPQPACSLFLAGAGVALALAFLIALPSLWTTIATGLAAVLPAALTRVRRYPVLGWLSVGFAVLTLVRIGFDPTLVGEAALSPTPFLNQLLPGYLLAAFGSALAAWRLAHTTAGRPYLVMQAFAAIFALVGVAMLVRHAMNGGIVDDGAPTLAEQAIYTLIAIGAGAILLALDRRSPSPVFRWGSIIAGVVSVVSTAAAHFVTLNPLFTNESTGSLPVLDLVMLAYLMPAAALAALAWFARGKRPDWYVAMLAATASALAFTYVTLSIRRFFQGEFIGAWKGMDGLETYTYSAVWLALGVALLLAGLWLGSRVVRAASGILVVVAVAKVFLFDMSELEGVLRALSFMGLGAVLIGIGMLYQRMLLSTR